MQFCFLLVVRFVSDETLVQGLLFAEELEMDIKGTSVFRAVEFFVVVKNKNIPLSSELACATDGSPSMADGHRDFLTFLKEVVHDMFTAHCVTHRQHLVTKNINARFHIKHRYYSSEQHQKHML